MDIDIKLLRETIKAMRDDVKSKNFDRDTLIEKYNFLFTNTKHIFETVINDTFNYMPQLNTMLDLRQEIKDKETKENMDKIVGKVLAEKYVYPVLDMSKENVEPEE